ncbi:MAG: thioredoxin [Puniceicoccaceae bacterium]
MDKDVVHASEKVPVLVDFWAPWCAPCQMLGPVLEKLERKAGGSWKLVKINVDEEPQLARRFGVRGIPAMKLFKSGEVVAELSGYRPEEILESWVQMNL